ncbi:aminodeoxychorismate synthase component I [Streptomyces sp. WI04-05B]|uniref:aminodeoxychorismate synthase component I n=1 Tax=Streptomyces TaxID=1883 RepID=UPI0029A95715|nr:MULTISPECIES: aminodeoxychorismate synthase component I [unclassified Streptomyces]MDX2546559.1 aminodeoxychorismate synthase component I [Streptomyces sp. WI04-05B]MDX2587809.1 aminodeoxychorismate synthase component I [Streptomyces sp. WI04-05A]MDX3751593.1 aminodeoxychorismate synthase component I [Streptomyces sp. AK08-02]
MRTLLLDNYDSYTFNLYQLIADINGREPVVMVNDDPALAGLRLEDFDNIVVSPGPGRPQHARDVGLLGDLLRRTTLPVLGVCFGHQMIGHLAGASVAAAPEPRHGHLAKISHEGDPLFAGIPREFVAVRYHSLCVREPLPEELIATAWADDGVLMALRHRDLPQWGVQFHPESIASQYGREILRNFAGLTRRTQNGQRPSTTVIDTGAHTDTRTAIHTRTALSDDPLSGAVEELGIISTVVPTAADSEAVFLRLFDNTPYCFWLDSSRVEEGLSRFSFLGDTSGPLSEVLTYRTGSGAVEVRDANGVHRATGSVFDVLEQRLRERRVPDSDLPFDLTGGYVGYFGYELKAECGAPGRHTAETPDAVWMFADRVIAVDHQEGLTYLVAVHNEETRRDAQEWVERTSAILRGLAPADAEPPGEPAAGPPPNAEEHLSRGRNQYLADITECGRQLTQGESYEICLTNKLHMPFHDDDTSFYLRLRRANPAPYAALLRLGDVTVFSSSPERFLRIERDRTVTSKPIKGTAPRDADPVRDAELAATLASSAKTQAENLMIVDLLRNDLGRVCEVGSIEVDPYLAVESYETVHQLVSTVRGRLSDGVSAMDCARQCFPGGSMTGAPKLRTMEIIDRLETEARGVYSGALGYFGLSGGTDLNIVIRTAVRVGDRLTIGAGGAIVLDSDSDEEYEEMLLKAAASLRAWRAPAVSDVSGSHR